MKSEAVTYQFHSIVDEIKTPIEIINPLNNSTIKTFGLWDTGATDCAITKNLVSKLNLPVFTKAKVIGINGLQTANVHYIKFQLENKNSSLSTRVTACDELSDDGSIGFLIGMDLITKGDLVISNYNNNTVLSFRIPSLEEFDFTK